ncbi:YciI-like protein [Sphingomonas sp. IW22]|uniref:YciI-like protein n=1 Tax=Sphingomonas sp. IW22 TaxID=3242489 RepID=UPI003520D324
MSHWLLIYELSSDYLARRGEYRAEHLSLGWEQADRGAILLGGAVGDPPESAMLLFSDRDAAFAFANADPYVINGLVRAWRVVPWTTVIGEQAAAPVRP